MKNVKVTNPKAILPEVDLPGADGAESLLNLDCHLFTVGSSRGLKYSDGINIDWKVSSRLDPIVDYTKALGGRRAHQRKAQQIVDGLFSAEEAFALGRYLMLRGDAIYIGAYALPIPVHLEPYEGIVGGEYDPIDLSVESDFDLPVPVVGIVSSSFPRYFESPAVVRVPVSEGGSFQAFCCVSGKRFLATPPFVFALEDAPERLVHYDIGFLVEDHEH